MMSNGSLTLFVTALSKSNLPWLLGLGRIEVCNGSYLEFRADRRRLDLAPISVQFCGVQATYDVGICYTRLI
jgi:hypothetical protein